MDTDPTPTPAPPSPPAPAHRGVLAVVATLALIAVFSFGIAVGGVLVGAGGGGTTGPVATGETDFDVIREAWDTLHSKYVGRDDLNDQELIWGAIDGMTEAVGDTGHTDFMTPAERESRNQSLSGKYVGIGVRIDTTEDGRPRITGVFPDSPAETAGLLPGDVFVAVDGRSTAGRTVDEVAGWVRGEAGTTVKITVSAEGTGPERTYDIVRADVPVDPVSWTMVPGTNTALIALDQFSNGAADRMVETLKEAREAGADRLVLDLRGNPGGYVNEAVGIASQFLSSGVVYIERNAAGEETRHEVSPTGEWRDLPVVVLIDGDSASSAEILAGALQDAGRATLIGETTFGTGTVLGEFELSDGSALRIGTVEWLTPNGRRIWHEGVAPDVSVSLGDSADRLSPGEVAPMSPAQVRTISDPQLARAIETVAREQVAQTPG